MAEIIARVTEGKGKVEGGLVELSNGDVTVRGRVASESENEFLVNWEDGARSVENKSDYELVVATKTAAPAVAPKGHVFDEPIDIGPQKEVTVELEVPEKFQMMHAKTAQENPAQPAGWAVPPMDANAYPGGELMAIEQQKRGETAQWEDAQNRPPVDAENPAQPAGFAVPPATGGPIPGQGADGLLMAARVIAEDVTGSNGIVELSKGNLRVAGRVLASDDDSFIVEWEDERRTVESKADYDLVIEAGIGDWARGKAVDFLEKKDMLIGTCQNCQGAGCDSCTRGLAPIKRDESGNFPNGETPSVRFRGGEPRDDEAHRNWKGLADYEV